MTERDKLLVGIRSEIRTEASRAVRQLLESGDLGRAALQALAEDQIHGTVRGVLERQLGERMIVRIEVQGGETDAAELERLRFIERETRLVLTGILGEETVRNEGLEDLHIADLARRVEKAFDD